eukprot:gene23242-28129_t
MARWYMLRVAVATFLLGMYASVAGDTTTGSAIIFPFKTGTTIDYWGYDTKMDNRLGTVSEEFAKTLYREESYNLVRAPIRALYHPEWTGDPWPTSYACSERDLTNIKAADATATIYSNIKQGYYEGTFYPAQPDYCLYNETDVPEFWDGENDKDRIKPYEFAVLIADFLKYFENLGFLHDYFGIENETGYVSPEKFMAIMDELMKLTEAAYFTYPTKGIVVPELYGPYASWFREVTKLGAFEKGYIQVAGTHHYGHEREWVKDGRLYKQEELLEWKDSMPFSTPKWHTEVHYAPIEDLMDTFGDTATEIDCVENMVMQFADYWDFHFSGFIYWAYRKESQAVDKSTKYHSMNLFTEASPPGSFPLLMDDHDGKQAKHQTTVTRAVRSGDQVTVFVTNNVPEALTDYEIVLASGELQSCTHSTYLPITITQYYLTDEMTTIEKTREGTSVETPLVGWRDDVATPTAANAFTVVSAPVFPLKAMEAISL